jgi:hypothetical protein
VNGFCPDGYVPAQEAIVRAAQYWFPERFAALERAAEPPSETKPGNSLEALARALSPLPVIPDALRQHEFQDIVNQTVHRLRNFLHQEKLKAYYFGDDGCASVSREFWATAHADGVMESGTYWPFGKPPRFYEWRPSHPLFLLQSELDALLSEEPPKKRPLPKAKMPELVEALRELDDLPNRSAQLQALSNMPEFCEFKITNALFREAARHVPRDAGRRSRRES